MIISVDHGNKSIKTPNTLFTSGLISSEGLQGFKTDYICWNGRYYKTGTNLLSLSQCSDGQEYLISLKFRPIAENKVVVKRLVYALTDELRTDYQQCMEQAAAWSKYVIPAYSF